MTFCGKSDVDKYARDRPLCYRAPSWSWASVDCPVRYLPGRIESSKVTVVDVHVQRLPGKNQFGRVTGGYLKLQGHLFSNFRVAFDAGTHYSLRKCCPNGNEVIASCIPDATLGSAEMQMKLFLPAHRVVLGLYPSFGRDPLRM